MARARRAAAERARRGGDDGRGKGGLRQATSKPWRGMVMGGGKGEIGGARDEERGDTPCRSHGLGAGRQAMSHRRR